MLDAVCPACGEIFPMEKDTQVGDNRMCPHCQELLTVIMVDPYLLELYQITSTANVWFDDDKKEAAKKHEKRNKHRHEESQDFEDEDELYRRKGKKSKNRDHGDW
jgi:uncharacterized Zn finger protein (UPF0148 family)